VWLSDDGTSVIGDGPVDSVMDAQCEIEAQRQRRGVAPPPAGALYDAAGRVLRRESIGVPTPPDDWPSGPREWTDAELPVLGEALRDAVTEYEERPQGGTPSLEELRQTIAFAVIQLSDHD